MRTCRREDRKSLPRNLIDRAMCLVMFKACRMWPAQAIRRGTIANLPTLPKVHEETVLSSYVQVNTAANLESRIFSSCVVAHPMLDYIQVLSG